MTGDEEEEEEGDEEGGKSDGGEEARFGRERGQFFGEGGEF